MGPTAAPNTLSENSPCTLCKIPKTKDQYSFHSESLKSSLMVKKVLSSLDVCVCVVSSKQMEEIKLH